MIIIGRYFPTEVSKGEIHLFVFGELRVNKGFDLLVNVFNSIKINWMIGISF